MALDTTNLRSRRALLAGTVGGLAALAAQAIGRPAPAQAAHAGAVQLGHPNSATNPTEITSTTLGFTAFYASGSVSEALSASVLRPPVRPRQR